MLYRFIKACAEISAGSVRGKFEVVCARALQLVELLLFAPSRRDKVPLAGIYPLSAHPFSFFSLS